MQVKSSPHGYLHSLVKTATTSPPPPKHSVWSASPLSLNAAARSLGSIGGTGAVPFRGRPIVEWAGETVPLSSWAGAYYRLRKAKGERHQAILRSLAFKWMRILFRCWKQRTPYDEGVYVDALRRRGSPVIAAMEETPALG